MNQEELRQFRQHLREIEREVARTLKDQTSCCGVTMAQCHVLLELGEAPTMNIVELANRLKLDASTLSRTIDGLVKSGQVDRSDNPDNRRSSLLRLTDKGLATHEAINLMCDRFYENFLNQVPAEKHEALLEAVKLLAGLFSGIQFSGCQPGQPCQAVIEEEQEK